ncbi:DUF2934 domain-containing protein [Frigoriglobus tundricola]|uniref:DUF2934 domain-containing protein n=1 Tax=Frigoriglobus tundricola TaxID=2774151 RepID=A0A6M5Z0K0_9BACT|nr:DUF2934 domain-containing protein [Frigoriglobus tundricola]QJW99859.1 hypothetical protein FTUN_7482 [Frigoriglobus tundricola]
MSGKASSHSASRPQPAKAAPRQTNPAKAADTTSLQPPTRNGVPDVEAVRARAYALWTHAGCPTGDGVEFWLRAEQELSHPG